MANTKGSDNPFPSVLFEEHVDPSNPASGFQRLFVDTDHLLKLRDSAGTVTTFGTGNLSDPMTTRGDLIYRNASNVTARLPRGSASQVLTSDGTDVAWATPASGFSDPMTTRGDIIIRNASNVTARLGRGTATYVLTSDGTDVAWAAPAAGGSGLLAVTSYRPGSNSNVATCSSSTLGDADSTNLIVTFTAPASGNVLVRLSALADETAADNVYWGIRESTTDLGHGLVLSGAGTVHCEIAIYISGISAGSHTYKWSFARGSGTHHILGGPNTGSNSFGPCVMEVWSAP